MRAIIKELVGFIRSDFNVWIYSLTFIFLFIAIRINYSYSAYWNLVNIYATGSERLIRFFILFAIPWFLVAVPKLVISGKLEVLRNRKFYISILLILIFISADSGFKLFSYLAERASSFDEQIYLTRIFSNFQGSFLLLVIFLLYYFYFKNIQWADFGLRFRNVNLKPYFILILVIVPMILWASFNQDFLTTYPSYKPWDVPVLFKLNKAITAIVHEMVYGLDFFAIELTFRGLLVIFIARFMGKDAVLPMAVVYCFLHFGKPEAETIASFLGGYFLGVVALSTKSIAPGLMLHLSLAYMMDLGAYLQHYIR
jgi:hypothetical protein